MALIEAWLPISVKAAYMDGAVPLIAKLREKRQVRLRYSGKVNFAVCG